MNSSSRPDESFLSRRISYIYVRMSLYSVYSRRPSTYDNTIYHQLLFDPCRKGGGGMYRNVVAATAHGPTSKNGCARSDYWHAQIVDIRSSGSIFFTWYTHTCRPAVRVYHKSEIDFLHNQQSMRKDIRREKQKKMSFPRWSHTMIATIYNTKCSIFTQTVYIYWDNIKMSLLLFCVRFPKYQMQTTRDTWTSSLWWQDSLLFLFSCFLGSWWRDGRIKKQNKTKQENISDRFNELESRRKCIRVQW